MPTPQEPTVEDLNFEEEWEVRPLSEYRIIATCIDNVEADTYKRVPEIVHVYGNDDGPAFSITYHMHRHM
jgi:hypothetical protein